MNIKSLRWNASRKNWLKNGDRRLRIRAFSPLPFISLFLIATFPSYADTAQKKTIIWSYDDDYTGQEEWGNLTPAFAACANGTSQSPISIANTTPATDPAPVFEYKPGDATLKNIGYTLQITFPYGQYYSESGKRYTLRSIEFHTPSEHIVKDIFYPLEIQFSHETADGQKLILVVFSDMLTALENFDIVLSSAPKNDGVSATITFNPASLLPKYTGHYAYTGSLTTPPCIEGIEWRLLKNTISLSKKQMEALSAFTRRNARLPQPVYMRTVKEISTPQP